MPPESIIRSRQNPIYKQIRSLLRRDRRHQERAFLVEGPRFIADAQRFGSAPALLVFSESFVEATGLSIGSVQSARILDDELFASISDTVTPQGMIGVFPFPVIAAAPDAIPLILVADGIQDPGNLGTLIRSAAGAGATRVVALTGTVDPWSPKVVRAAAAAHFLVSIESIPISDLAQIVPSRGRVVGADASGTVAYDRVDLTGPTVLIVGAEGSGLSDRARSMVDQFVSIPLQSRVESLNAGVAGSIMLYEANRQRRASGQI
jgi:TrmH family RNA methyltransferase